MGIRKTVFGVDGMTCPSCVSRVQSAVGSLSGVIAAEATLRPPAVTVEYDDSVVGPERIQESVEKAGYAVRDGNNPRTPLAVGAGILICALYLVAQASGLFSSIPTFDASVGYAMLLVAGLLTSVHCVAMCGGIALAQNAPAKTAERGAERASAIFPGLLYNAGRVVSYTIIGGVAGAVGSAFSFSPTVKGLIAGAAGLLMVAFGLRTLGLLHFLDRRPSFLPAPPARGGPFLVGLLNGLMPCGPLQAMQLYALGTGSFFTGALSMLIFSLGTVPLMFVLSAGSAFLPRKALPSIARSGAVVVMFLGFMTFARAASLAGLSMPLSATLAPARTIAAVPAAQPPSAGNVVEVAGKTLKANIADGVQTVVTEFTDGDYVPFTVKAGVPLKWTIRASAGGLTGCNNPLTVPEYGIKKRLVPGDNLIEFTPSKPGRIVYTCWMGMVRSVITVEGD